jgi:hypothetical protein
MPEDFITEPHQRFLRVVLLLAEETIVEIKRLAQQPSERHGLYII